MEKEKILIIDDSEMNRSILADILYDEFDITEAENGIQALEILKKDSAKYSLVLLDIVMPEMDGFGVLAEMNRMKLMDDLPVIMVSAETAPSQIERAYELGATDFIMRPFDASIVHRRVVNTILLYVKQKKLISIIEEQVNEKEQNSSLMVDILSHIVEFRNGESGLHIQHVRSLTKLLLHKLCEKTDRYPLSETDISIISMASALHDIGKISIDDKILNKPGALTNEEYAIMKTHSTIGAQMIESLDSLLYKNNPLIKRAYEICRWHHERYDGKGYPDGLAGDKIPIGAQIVALADVYDALTSERVYKKAIPHEKALKMILEGKCGSFNPLLLKCLEESAESIKYLLTSKATEISARHEIHGFADAIQHTKGGDIASDRTLRLLDYERMKYNFFAAMTEEIQFEYTVATDTITISPIGARKLGVDEVITNPDRCEKLNGIIGGSWLNRLIAHFISCGPEDIEYRQEKQLHCNGEYRWHNIIIRAIWNDEPPRLEGFIGKAVDVHDAHTTITELKENATRDPLTGLLNRAEARKQIERRILNYPNHKYALACFDIDFFKQANDTYGHLFGDKVLKDVSNRLVRSIRQSDICARMGGDEFLIFFEYDVDINLIIARIFKSLCGRVERFDVTVSMGIVEMDAVGEEYEELFHKADLALYYSKQRGRAQYHLYDDSMKDTLPESNVTEIDGCEENNQGGNDK